MPGVAKWSRVLHRWGAVAVAIPLAVVLCTGVLLLLKKELDWVQPPTQRGVSSAPVVELDEILAQAKRVPEAEIETWEDIDRLDIRPSRGLVKVQSTNSYEIQLDSQTVEILQVAYRRSDLIESLHDGSFFADRAKLWVFLPSALILICLWLSGLYLFVRPHYAKWKRRRAGGQG